MVFKLACMVLACMVICAPHVEAAITCGTVINKVSPCIQYLRKGGAVPAKCCAGVKSLNAMAKTTPDRRTACSCLKEALTVVPGLNVGRAEGLPGKCGVNIPFKISPSMDCSKVK